MPEYLAPGVYVEEIDTGSKPIEGVSTSTTGVVGVTERGPVNVPILVTSYGEFTRWFGERLYVTRVLDGAGASRAAAGLHDRGGSLTDPASTLLLRAAGEGSGAAGQP